MRGEARKKVGYQHDEKYCDFKSNNIQSNGLYILIILKFMFFCYGPDLH